MDKKRRSLLTSLSALSAYVVGSSLAASTNSPSHSRANEDNKLCGELLNHEFRPLMSSDQHSLCSQYNGNVVLVVNTASRCGFTPQFEGLETLHQRYASKGLSVLGFPSDDFRQELGSEEEVAEFCQLNYGVSFPMYQKVSVSRSSAHPLFRTLAAETGKPVTWNFNKYLIGRDGRTVQYFPSSAMPLGNDMLQAIEKQLESS